MEYEKRATEAARDRELARGQARDPTRLKVPVERLTSPALSMSVFLAFHRDASPMYIAVRDASLVDARDAARIGNANALFIVLRDLSEKSRETELLTRSRLFLPSRRDRDVYIGEIRESISLVYLRRRVSARRTFHITILRFYDFLLRSRLSMHSSCITRIKRKSLIYANNFSRPGIPEVIRNIAGKFLARRIIN